ncbi:MAG: hypothetical protein IJ214_12220, partial [Clostridia bacterium]|nr:hypothetical protein [Clostridia bacterium]
LFGINIGCAFVEEETNGGVLSWKPKKPPKKAAFVGLKAAIAKRNENANLQKNTMTRAALSPRQRARLGHLHTRPGDAGTDDQQTAST